MSWDIRLSVELGEVALIVFSPWSSGDGLVLGHRTLTYGPFTASAPQETRTFGIERIDMARETKGELSLHELALMGG